MFKILCREPAEVEGKDGVCCPYKKGRPVISVGIKDEDGEWREADFLLDTGAYRTVISAYDADDLGLDSGKWNDIEEGVTSPFGRGDLFLKRVEVQIARFPPFFLTIGFSKEMSKGIRLLGRETLLQHFGIAFDEKETTIFTKQ